MIACALRGWAFVLWGVVVALYFVYILTMRSKGKR